MAYRPKEILFCPTTECNLSCRHCTTKKYKPRLPLSAATRFLRECKSVGIKRVGFTGGEPFLVPRFLSSAVKASVELGYLFDRIMTNGLWWSDRNELHDILRRLYKSGYDGDICVSLDIFHRGSLVKARQFIEEALGVWQRPDVVSIASVMGFKEDDTRRRLKSMARLCNAKYVELPSGRSCIRGDNLLLKIYKIDLSSVSKASILKTGWDGEWFQEDYCKGPGDVFMVMPDGSVKPCCGYASDHPELTIGNIRTQSAAQIIKNFRNNRFANTVFTSGLSRIRKRLESSGVKFPGRTSNHCFFCDYILNNVPKGDLYRCLDH